jgi:macrolide transport system ATP-binding/permease protein
MDTLLKDLRFAVRSLLKRPGFTAIALVTLALGIGVNTALFTLFNIFLRPKPIKDPDSVVYLTYQGDRREDQFSFQDYIYFRDHTQVFSDVIANLQEKFLLGDHKPGAEPEEILGNFVSDNFLSTLGGGTQLGRFFSVEENSVPGRDSVVVLSNKFWRRRFGGDPQMIGRSISLNGKPFTVIGVTSPKFIGLRYDVPDIWLPLMMRSSMPTVYFEETAAEDRDWFGSKGFPWLTLHARMKPGRTVADARSELTVLASQLPQSPSTTGPRPIVSAVAFSDVRGDNNVWGIMFAVLGASGLVLLIACSNIANMLLARAAARQKEIAVRLCLGASRWRVVRQLLTESMLLSVCGGIAGVLLAWWSLSLLLNVILTRYGGGEVSRLVVDLSPDARVLTFSFLLSLVSGIAFGLVPALRATSPDLISLIKDEGAGATGRSTRSLLRNGLVVAQVSLCLVLLIAAGLLLRSVGHVLNRDPGFDAKHLIQVRYSLELSGYDNKKAEQFHEQLISRLSTLPGVESIAPHSEFGGRATIKVLDGSNATFERVPFDWVQANYLGTIGTRITQGRGFTEDEQRSKSPVIVVSESTARNIWPGVNPIGKTVHIERLLRDGRSVIEFQSAQVIGVAQDNQTYRVGQESPFFFYATQPQTPEWMDTAILVRTSGDAAAFKSSVTKETYALEPVLRLDVSTMHEIAANDNNVSETRAASELATGLGGLALLLAAIGIYGVMAWSVSQRTREIGIRMALGAQGRDVLRLVLRQGMRLVLIGVVVGLPLSLAVTQLMKRMLFGLSPTDPLTLVTVSALLSFVALSACYIPARKATKVDPLVALRYE